MEFSLEQLPAQVQFSEGEKSTPEKNRVMCPGSFLFIFVRSGVFSLVIDGRKVTCTSGEFTIAVAKQYYEIAKCSKKVLCFLVSVQWPFVMNSKVLCHFVEALVNNGPVKLIPDHFDGIAIWRIMKLLEHFYSVRSNPSRFSMPSFTGALNLLVLQAGWLYGNSGGSEAMRYSRKESLAMHFLKLMIEHFRTKRTLKFYADCLCVTEGYLNKAVREVTGKTVGSCIAEVVISESKYLLEVSDATLESISEQLNFSSPGSFSRFFKKYTHQTPNTYRKGYHG